MQKILDPQFIEIQLLVLKNWLFNEVFGPNLIHNVSLHGCLFRSETIKRSNQ